MYMIRSDAIHAWMEKYRDVIFDAQSYIWQHPQTGYKEWDANAYMEKAFENLGYTLIRAENIPGFYTDVETGLPGPKVCLLAELDSLICRSHPDADNETGAVHACGHSAQCAALLGVAYALKEPGVLDGLCGSIRLMVVPAEELIEIGYREELRRQGVIRYLGGKVEFMHRRFFQGVDMAMMIHLGTHDGPAFLISKGGNGCLVKNITYLGVAAHAGGAPHDGVNALYAASTAMQAVNALRETFRDEDHIRFHPIITQGGQAVNAIPNAVKMETYVRGASMEAIRDVNLRVNRALAGCAAAFGANVILNDRPGYSPLHNDPILAQYAAEAMAAVAGEENVKHDDAWHTGSTDMGDISRVMPALHPFVRGAKGIAHGENYKITDLETACVLAAKALLATAIKLLENNAEAARNVMAKATPQYPTQEAFLQAIDQLTLDKKAVIYREDGSVILDYIAQDGA